MGRSTRSFLAACVVAPCVAVLAGCGQSVPSDAVAKVGNIAISKASFNHWLSVAQKSQAAQSAPGTPVVPLDSPNFTSCIAFHQRSDPKPPKGQPNTTPTALKAQCQQQFNAARDQVVPFLITAVWLQGEAVDMGVKVTAAETAKALKTIEATRFPTPAQLQQFLLKSGETQEDLLFRVRIDTLSNKLRTKVTSVSQTVSPPEIASYYAKNTQQFTKAETRDLRIALVKTPASAKHVRALLDSGQSFGKVAKQYSIDPATKGQGGSLIGVTAHQQDAALDAAIFGAAVGQLVGPVKTPFGYEIFRVQKITPATKQTLAQATLLIKQLITAQRQQTTLTTFVNHFEAKWRSRTTCGAGYVVAQDCKNGPKSSTTTTPGTPSGQ